VRVTRIYLRNYRTFEDPVELEIPPGLIGVYGVNGAGKSSLVEALPFAFYGTSRTTKDEVRTAGVGAECVVEVEFEHEGHLYLVRRSISGANHTVRAEAHCDRLAVAEGARDVTRYVHSVLGMDDASFRASVFAEQKQLAAFSRHRPEERRRLVLQLLGVTPLDAARDQARRDAHQAHQQLDRVRVLLADLEVLSADRGRADEEAAAAAARAQGAKEAETGASEVLEVATKEHHRLDQLRQEWEAVVAEGRARREQLDQAQARLAGLEAEDEALTVMSARLPVLSAEAEGLAHAEDLLSRVTVAQRATEALAGLAVVERPEPPDPDALASAQARLVTARAGVAELEGRLAGAAAERERAAEAVGKAAGLEEGAACPLCGQALGDAFHQVQAHREAELAEVEARVAALSKRLPEARREADEQARVAEQAANRAAEAEAAGRAFERAAAEREVAERQAAQAVAALGHDPTPEEAEQARADVIRRRGAAEELARLSGRLERQAPLQADLSLERARVEELAGQVEVIRDKLRGLDHRKEALDAAAVALERSNAAYRQASETSRQAELASASAQARAEAARTRLADAEEQHRQVEEQAEEARHLGRAAELLARFRDTVVATVGPRLSAQAAELFGELTDHEYDHLEVDPDTYEIKLCDQGITYGMDRFSGSETDLANLSLRVAISEQVRFQAGGAVGLLVLDEVFGPLDDDRKERMLLALERLRARFRQVIVVTHAGDIKERLPNAIEVMKLPGRRAAARVVA
jgi:DNA repair protein SbcC/Rad50